MQKSQIARKWRAVACAEVIGTIKCKKVKLLGSGMHWRALACTGARWRTGVIGTIKSKKVKLLGSGAHWHAVAHAGVIGTIN